MKNKKLSIRISDADWQRFHEKAEQANMTLTEYITDCCLGKQIVVIDGLDEVIRQQKAIGRNLNQLTTLANMGKVKTVYSHYHNTEEGIGFARKVILFDLSI